MANLKEKGSNMSATTTNPVSAVVALKKEWQERLDGQYLSCPSVRSMLAELSMIVHGTPAEELVKPQYELTDEEHDRGLFETAPLRNLFNEVINELL